ncbi:MAG: JAB domain-containing protein [Streptococcus parasanguinis]
MDEGFIKTSELMSSEQIMSSQKLAHKIQQEIGHKKQEHLVALYLNTQNEIIHQQTIFIGTVNRSIAWNRREILHYAIKQHGNLHYLGSQSSIWCCIHPSKNDDEVTQRVLRSSVIVRNGFDPIDHLIVSN